MVEHYAIVDVERHLGSIARADSAMQRGHLIASHGCDAEEVQAMDAPTRTERHRLLHTKAAAVTIDTGDEPDGDWFDAEGYTTEEPEESGPEPDPLSEIAINTGGGGGGGGFISGGVIAYSPHAVRRVPATRYNIEKRVPLGPALQSLAYIERDAEAAINDLLGSEPRPAENIEVHVEWDAEALPPGYVMLINLYLTRTAAAPAEPAASHYARKHMLNL